MNRVKSVYCLLNLLLITLWVVGCKSPPPTSPVTPSLIVQVATATPLPPTAPSPTVPATVTPTQPTPTPRPGPATPVAVAVEAVSASVPEILTPTTVSDPQNGLTWTFYPLPGVYICDQAIKDSCYEAWPETQALVIDQEDRVWTAHPDGVRVLTETGEGATRLLYTQVQGLPYDEVQSLAVDQTGRVWAEARGRLAVFNGSAWAPVEILPGRSVSALTTDPAGQIWVYTGQELVKFDNNLQVQEVIPSGAAPATLTTLTIDQAGQVWAGSLGGGLSRFDGAKWTTYPAPNPVFWDYTNKLRIDPQGNLWVIFGSCFIDPSSCASMGLSRFDGQRWDHYLQSTAHFNTAEDMIFDVTLDPQGNTWVVTASGIKQFDGQDWATYLQDPDPGGHLIAIDGLGNKWIGSYKQVFKISP